MRASKSVILFYFLSIFCSSIIAQNHKDSIRTSYGFTAKKVASGVWFIDDQRNDNSYLVEGDKKALLIDTGIGAGDLLKFVKLLTDLPIIVMNTHAHSDHLGGDFQFDNIYIHPDEIDNAKANLKLESRNHVIKYILENSPDYGEENILKVDEYKTPDFLSIREGFVFDLGNRSLEVIETPGHTPGCICLLDRKNRQLFSGDNNCPHIWLFMNNSTSVETYMKSLEKLMSYSEYFDTIFPGHSEPMGKDYLDEVHQCASNILEGNCDPEPYQNFGEEVKHCKYKRATVVYNTSHIYNNK